MTSMRNANAAWSAGGRPKSMGPPERARAERVGADIGGGEPGGGAAGAGGREGGRQREGGGGGVSGDGPGAVEGEAAGGATRGPRALKPRPGVRRLRRRGAGGSRWRRRLRGRLKGDRSRDRADLLGAPWRSRCRRRPDARGGPARGGGERGKDSPTREEPPRQGRNARWRNRGSNPAGRVEWDQRFARRGEAPIGCEAGPAAGRGKQRPAAMIRAAGHGVGGQAGEPV